MITINGKVYKGNDLLIDKHGNVFIDGVLQGSTKEPEPEPKISLVDWIRNLFK